MKKLKKQGKARLQLRLLQQQNNSSTKSQLCFDERKYKEKNSINITISEVAQNNFSLLTERSDAGTFHTFFDLHNYLLISAYNFELYLYFVFKILNMKVQDFGQY